MPAKRFCDFERDFQTEIGRVAREAHARAFKLAPQRYRLTYRSAVEGCGGEIEIEPNDGRALLPGWWSAHNAFTTAETADQWVARAVEVARRLPILPLE